MRALTQADLRAVLDYNPDTGVFIWIKTKHPSKLGKPAGWLDSNGYNRITVNGTDHPAHRLAWLYMKGRWPEKYIDHINGVPGDNRFCNLREATPMQNSANQRIRKRNLAGFKGVIKHRRKWKAAFTHNYTTIYLGLFDTPEEAHAAYLKASTELNGEFARAA